MNRNQKKILTAVVIIIAISFIVWIIFGGEIFTKTQVLVEKKDELFPDMITKEWRNKFIWGLDLTGMVSFLSVIIGGFFYFRLRDKKHK
ncbi:MAG: hypothetical protein CVV24_05905 [Ignavibacteriae bacterium HGW-Ignavibacteriae-3]|nr:MAG: hypothetical protein CVV24_05905 [Ignavibacteriae bacterium HGW-Ignavibacteriae-3]